VSRETLRRLFILLEKDVNGKITKVAHCRFVLDLVSFFFPSFVSQLNIRLAKQHWGIWTHRGKERPDYDLFYRIFFEWPLVLITTPHVNEERYAEFWDCVRVAIFEKNMRNSDRYMEPRYCVIPSGISMPLREVSRGHTSRSTMMIPVSSSGSAIVTHDVPVPNQQPQPPQKKKKVSTSATVVESKKAPPLDPEDEELDAMIDYYVGMSDQYISQATFNLRARYAHTQEEQRHRRCQQEAKARAQLEEHQVLAVALPATSEPKGLEVATTSTGGSLPQPPDSGGEGEGKNSTTIPSFSSERENFVRHRTRLRLAELEFHKREDPKVPKSARSARPYTCSRRSIHTLTPRHPQGHVTETHRRAMLLVSPQIKQLY